MTKIHIIVLLILVASCTSSRIPIVEVSNDSVGNCIPQYFNWELCPNDPGVQNYTLFPDSAVIKPPAYTIVEYAPVRIVIEGTTNLTSVPDGNYLIMVWNVQNGNKYQVGGSLAQGLTISNGRFRLQGGFAVPPLANATNLLITFDTYQNPKKNELVCVELTENIGPNLCGLRCLPQWEYCENDPGRVNYTLKVSNVTTSPDAEYITPGSKVSVHVIGTTNMTSVPDGNYLIMVWQVSNGTKVQYGGVLNTILSIHNDKTFSISVSFTLPDLLFDDQLYFTLDTYMNPTKREAVCIEVTQQIGSGCKHPLVEGKL